MKLTFVETNVFSSRIGKLGLEDELRQLQLHLIANPSRGRLDPGTGGLRKTRMPDPSRGKGKRGGARVHYLWLSNKRVLYLIFVYSKDEADSLSADQKEELKKVVDAIKAEHSR